MLFIGNINSSTVGMFSMPCLYLDASLTKQHKAFPFSRTLHLFNTSDK